jgi:hypothetical protein
LESEISSAVSSRWVNLSQQSRVNFAQRYRHAHVFICYLAYLLLSLLKYCLRHTEFTAESALLGLATMYKVYLRDSKHRFKLSRVVALTKRQEAILKSLDRKLLSLEN